jgi:hypothetical protein
MLGSREDSARESCRRYSRPRQVFSLAPNACWTCNRPSNLQETQSWPAMRSLLRCSQEAQASSGFGPNSGMCVSGRCDEHRLGFRQSTRVHRPTIRTSRCTCIGRGTLLSVRSASNSRLRADDGPAESTGLPSACDQIPDHPASERLHPCVHGRQDFCGRSIMQFTTRSVASSPFVFSKLFQNLRN